MSDHGSGDVREAASCFRSLVAFAEDRGDHLLAALVTDAREHFLATHRRDVEGAGDAS